jgi:CubicO group peptidase (beta-lactamase class C family)
MKLMLLLLIGLGSTLAEIPDNFYKTWQEIESIYQKGLKENQIIGSSMIFIADGKIIARSLNGFADLNDNRAVDENTIYHWASITKTFTGIAIMQLRDRGLLQLEDPIINFIPELKKVHNPYGNMNQISLKHLLTHSSGFRFSTWPWGGDLDWHPFEPTRWSQLVAMFPYTEILFQPGTKYSYSNPGIIFLGRVIEILSGDDYEVYIDKNIFKPLKMYHSYFDTTPYHLLPYRSNNYFLKSDTLIENGLDFNTGITVSNGGLNAPLTDMSKYVSFLMDSKRDFYPILDRSSLEEMWEPQFLMGNQDRFTVSRGLAFQILERNDIRVIGHTGSQRGFLSFYYVHPESKTAVILVFNTLDLSTSGISNTRKLLDQIRDLFLERIWPLYID